MYCFFAYFGLECNLNLLYESIFNLFILFLKIKICEVSLPYILDHLFGEDQRLQKIIGTNMNLSLNEGTY